MFLQLGMLVFLLVAARGCFLLLREISWLTSKSPPKDKLTLSFLKRAYQRYASHAKTGLEKTLRDFPFQDYRLYQVSDFAYFYLDPVPDCIKYHLRQGHRWESNLMPYFKQYVRRNTQVLDIGAHIGVHTIYFAQLLAGQGRVLAFEPQKKLFSELNANLAANRVQNVKTFPFAVGDESGSVEMNARRRENEGATSIGQGGDRARLVTIDSLRIKNVSFMKIDVEGYEDRVLRGALRTIQASRPVILLEIMCSDDRKRPEVKARVEEISAFLSSLGYPSLRHVSLSDYLALPG